VVLCYVYTKVCNLGYLAGSLAVHVRLQCVTNRTEHAGVKLISVNILLASSGTQGLSARKEGNINFSLTIWFLWLLPLPLRVPSSDLMAS
jgi:hypothetical protein